MISSVVNALTGCLQRIDDIPLSWIDPIPVARVLVWLRQSRSLFVTHPDYGGPGAATINALTDQAILIFNGLAVVRFLYHIMLAHVVVWGADHSRDARKRIFWERYSDCMRCLIDSVACALAARRSDVSCALGTGSEPN